MTKIKARVYQKNVPKRVSSDEYLMQVLKAISTKGVVKATKFVSESLVIRAVRRTYKAYGGKPSRTWDGSLEIVLSIGKPNYAEREKIKRFKKAGIKFPIENVQIKGLR